MIESGWTTFTYRRGGSEKQDRQRVLAAQKMGKTLDGERMTERQVDDAIRVTEERLSALKDAVTRKKGKKTGRK